MPGGTMTQYAYPLEWKADVAVEAIGEDFVADAALCQSLLAGFPHLPFTPEQARELTGSALGADVMAPGSGQPRPSPRRVHSTPRNAPCPCGTGRKFKHCCGK